MRKSAILFLFICMYLSVSAQTIYTVSTGAGLTFSPNLVTVTVGDIVRFNVGSSHPVLEVSQATWNVNGGTALPGGFSFPGGNGDYTASSPGTYYYICTAHISSGMKGRIVVNAITAIERTNAEKEDHLYPNPAENYIVYKSGGNLTSPEIKIIDISGRVVKVVKQSSDSDDQIRIGVEDLNKGLYLIQLKSGDKTILKRFMKF